MNINMGGIATLAYDSGTGGYGANAVDNIVPTAWEEIDYGLSTGITDLGGAASGAKGVINFTIKAPTAGSGVSFSYVGRNGGGHIADGATSGDTGGVRAMDLVVDLVNYNSAHFGLRMGAAGEIELPSFTCKDKAVAGNNASCTTGYKDNPYGVSYYTTLKLGPISIGGQATFKDPMDPTVLGVKNKRSIVLGAAFLVGDTLSVSYGVGFDRVRYNNASRGLVEDTGLGGDTMNQNEYSRSNFRGYSAAVNLGPVALKGTKNFVDGFGENFSSAPRSHSEINLSIAF